MDLQQLKIKQDAFNRRSEALVAATNEFLSGFFQELDAFIRAAQQIGLQHVQAHSEDRSGDVMRYRFQIAGIRLEALFAIATAYEPGTEQRTERPLSVHMPIYPDYSDEQSELPWCDLVCIDVGLHMRAELRRMKFEKNGEVMTLQTPVRYIDVQHKVTVETGRAMAKVLIQDLYQYEPVWTGVPTRNNVLAASDNRRDRQTYIGFIPPDQK